MRLPESIFIESTPNSVFFHMKNEISIALPEFDHIGFADGWNGVPPGTHFPAIDLITIVEDRDVAHHGAPLLGEDVQIFTESLERYFEILQDDIGL